MIRTNASTPPPRPAQDSTPAREAAGSKEIKPAQKPTESKETTLSKNPESKPDYSTKNLSSQQKQNLTTLYRGTWNDQANSIVENGSAGGTLRNADAEKVTERDRLEQIGNHEGVQWSTKNQIRELDSAIMFETKFKQNLKMQPATAKQKADTHQAIDQLDASPGRKDQLRKTLNEKIPTKEPDSRRPVEYTSNPDIALAFASNKATESVVEMKVDAERYGVPGSKIEKGTIFPNEAPVYSPKIISSDEANRGFTFGSDPVAIIPSPINPAVASSVFSSPNQPASDLVDREQNQSLVQEQQESAQQLSRIAHFCAALISFFSSNSNVTDSSSSAQH